jgi:hypothetical protein
MEMEQFVIEAASNREKRVHDVAHEHFRQKNENLDRISEFWMEKQK